MRRTPATECLLQMVGHPNANCEAKVFRKTHDSVNGGGFCLAASAGLILG